MIEVLNSLLPEVVKVLRPDEWDSLCINRRKPYTLRMFRQFGQYRVCLHRFDYCEEQDSFLHPHPWPAAFLILEGSYLQELGYSPDLTSDPISISRQYMRTGSVYEITDRHVWHKITPQCQTYTIMVNGLPWENPHSQVRTTKGKDLEKMEKWQIEEELEVFEYLIKENINQYFFED